MVPSPIRNAVEGSFVTSWTIDSRSGIVRSLRRCRGHVQRWSRGSLVWDAGRRIGEGVRRAGRSARSVGVARAGTPVLRSSFLYRWLTAEPEPEVIVIDLRETRTAGPVLVVFHRVIDRVASATPTSMLIAGFSNVADTVRAAPVRVAGTVTGTAVVSFATVTAISGSLTSTTMVASIVLLGLSILASRNTMSWRVLMETRPVRSLITALEPPQPPSGGDAPGAAVGSKSRDSAMESGSDDEIER